MFEPIISKRCSKCKEIKPLSKFYKDRQKKDGHAYQCKDCRMLHQRFYLQTEKGKETRKQTQKRYRQTEKSKQWQKRYAHGAKVKDYQKRYRQSAKNKEVHKRYSQGEKFKQTQKRYRQSAKGKNFRRKYDLQWQKLHPEKVLARLAVNNAIRAGTLPAAKSLKCAYCPNPAKQYHHYLGYAAEHVLDVLPACRKCHYAMNRSADSLSKGFTLKRQDIA